MPLPPPRKPAAAPANNGRVAPGPNRPRGGGFILPPPPADSDAYSTDSDSSDHAVDDDEEDEDDDDAAEQTVRRDELPPDDLPSRPGEDGDRIAGRPKPEAPQPALAPAAAPAALNEPPPKRGKGTSSKAAGEAAAQRAAAAAVAKRVQQQQQQQLLVQQQRRKVLQSRADEKVNVTGPAASAAGPSKGKAKAAASSSTSGPNAKQQAEEDDDDYDLGFGPGPSMTASQSLDMDMDGEELWMLSYCVVCDKLIGDSSGMPDTPGGASTTSSRTGTEPPSPLAGPVATQSEERDGKGTAANANAAEGPARRGSKASIHTNASSGSGAPVRRNHSSSRLSAFHVRAGGTSGAGQPPRRTGSTGSRLNALSNLKPTTKLHQDKDHQRSSSSSKPAPSTSADSDAKLSRADSSASIASKAASSAAGSSPAPPSISSHGHSSASSVKSRTRARGAGKSQGSGSGAETPAADERRGSTAMVPSLSSNTTSSGKGTVSSSATRDGKDKAKESSASQRPAKNALYCSERCRLIDQQRSAGLGELRPYLSQPLSTIGSMGAGNFPSIAPAAIAVTTVGSDQPAAVIPVASSTLSLSIAAASRGNSFPVLAATAVVAASATGATPMPALVELAKSSAAGSATLNHGLSMSLGMGGPLAFAGPGGPMAGALGGRPVLTSKVTTPLGPIDPATTNLGSFATHGPSSLTMAPLAFPPASFPVQLMGGAASAAGPPPPAGRRPPPPPGPHPWASVVGNSGPVSEGECPGCVDCCSCPECLLADEEAEARTTSAASGTAPSGSGASDTATSESSYAALHGAGGPAGGYGGGADGSGHGGAGGKGKPRTASGRLLTPHNLVPLDEGQTDYFGAYPEQMRQAMLEQARLQSQQAQQQSAGAGSARTGASSMSRDRSQSNRSMRSEHAGVGSTMVGSMEAAYVAAALGSTARMGSSSGATTIGRTSRSGTGTATSSSTVSRPRSALSSNLDDVGPVSASGLGSDPSSQLAHRLGARIDLARPAATSSASTSFSAAPTVLPPPSAPASNYDGPSSSAITAMPGDGAGRARSTFDLDGDDGEMGLSAADGGRSSSGTRFNTAGMLGTSLGTALHRRSRSALSGPGAGAGAGVSARPRMGSGSLRAGGTGSTSSRRASAAALTSGSYASPLRFLQRGELHTGSPSVAAIDFESMRARSAAAAGRGGNAADRSAESEVGEDFLDLSARAGAGRDRSEALTIPEGGSNWRALGHRRTGSAMSARSALEVSLDGRRPVSMLSGTGGTSFGALNSLKRTQALVMARELQGDRDANRGASTGSSSAAAAGRDVLPSAPQHRSSTPSSTEASMVSSQSGTDGSAGASASVSMATSLDAVREGKEEHHQRRAGDVLGGGLETAQQSQRSSGESSRASLMRVQGAASPSKKVPQGAAGSSGSLSKRRYSTGATSSRAAGSSSGGGFLSSLWSSIRGGGGGSSSGSSASAQQNAMPRTETAPAAAASSGADRRSILSLRSSTNPAVRETVKEEDERSALPGKSDQSPSSTSAVDAEDQALTTSANLDRGETIKPSRTGRGVAGASRRYDSMRSEASGRDVSSVRSGSTGVGSDWSGPNAPAQAGGSGRSAGSRLNSKRSGDLSTLPSYRAGSSSTTSTTMTMVAKPTMRRGSVPFFTTEIGHGQIPGDAAELLEEDDNEDGRPRSFSNSSQKGMMHHAHRHSISNGAAAGVESVERRRLAKLEQQRAHRQQRSRDVSVLPPLLAPTTRSNSASSSNLRLLHGSSIGMVNPASARASSHGRVAPAALPLTAAGIGRPTTPGALIPPTLRSPRSFQNGNLVDPLVAGMGFSPTRPASTSQQAFYSTSPRGRGLGWGSSMTPLSAAGSATNSAAITPVASAVNLAMLGQPHSYSGNIRAGTVPAPVGRGSVGGGAMHGHAHQHHAHPHHHHHHHHHHHAHGHAHAHHGRGRSHHHHTHSHGHASATTPSAAVPGGLNLNAAGKVPTGLLPTTGHLGTLGMLPHSQTAHFSRHATMPSLMYARSATPSVPEHGGEMSSEALLAAGTTTNGGGGGGVVGGNLLAGPSSPTAKMFGRGGPGGTGGYGKPGAGGLARPRSGLGWRSESPAPMAAGVVPNGGFPATATNPGASGVAGAIEGITLLSAQQYQEHLALQQQRAGSTAGFVAGANNLMSGAGVGAGAGAGFSRSRRTWSHEALSSMAGSGRTYPIMSLPGNAEVHDRYDEEWTSLINSTRAEEPGQAQSRAQTQTLAGKGAGQAGQPLQGQQQQQRQPQQPFVQPNTSQHRKALFHFG